MATIQAEEDRAAAHRTSLKNRAAAEKQRAGLLAGSKTKRDKLRDDWQPLIDREVEFDGKGKQQDGILVRDGRGPR